ncbi:hypothetical protein THAOC_21986, partial [Thalassiosira oceanica]
HPEESKFPCPDLLDSRYMKPPHLNSLSVYGPPASSGKSCRLLIKRQFRLNYVVYLANSEPRASNDSSNDTEEGSRRCGRMIDQGVRKQKTQQEVDAWEAPNATA